MTDFRRVILVGLAFTGVVVACGSDPKPTEPCKDARPDFELLIKAQSGPLPEDLVVKVEFSGGEEDYVLANPGNTQAVLFCDPADRDGNVIDAGATGSGAGGGGEGGGGGAPADVDVDALFCEVWSFGSARITVETAAYPMTEPVELAHEEDVCTVQTELELSMSDGGMSR